MSHCRLEASALGVDHVASEVGRFSGPCIQCLKFMPGSGIYASEQLDSAFFAVLAKLADSNPISAVDQQARTWVHG